MTIKTLEVIHALLENEVKHAEKLLDEAKEQKNKLYDYMNDDDIVKSPAYKTYKLALEHYQDLLYALSEFKHKEW